MPEWEFRQVSAGGETAGLAVVAVNLFEFHLVLEIHSSHCKSSAAVNMRSLAFPLLTMTM